MHETHRIEVDLHHLGLRAKRVAVDGVVGQARAERDDEIGLAEHFPRDGAGEAAGDADRKRIVIVHAAAEQRVRQQRAARFRQFLELLAAAGPDDAAAGDEDRAFRPGELFGHLGELIRVRWNRRDHRRDLRGRLVLADVRQRLQLQIVRDAEHDRLALVAGDVKRLAHILVHPLRAVRRDVVRAAGDGERLLLDHLAVPLCADRRLAREHDHRHLAARRRGQRRHDLRETRTARHRGDADLAGGAGVAHRHRAGAVLMARVIGVHAVDVLHRRHPVHVAVAHQREVMIDSLGREGIGQRHIGRHVAGRRRAHEDFP